MSDDIDDFEDFKNKCLTIAVQAITLIQEGFLQEKDRCDPVMIQRRWHIRMTVPQLTARGLRERSNE